MALANGFRAKAAAVGLGLASVVVPAAIAEEQPQQYASVDTSGQSPIITTASMTSNFQITDDAERDAIDWAGRSDGIGISVEIGRDSKVPAAKIQDVLNRDFTLAGESNVSFFVEYDERPSTLITYHYGAKGAASHGPFYLNDSQGEPVQKAVDQNHFYEANPHLGF
ncbi:MAG: hypothetical protein AAFR51_03980 [Pseudomonadota bacterium]